MRNIKKKGKHVQLKKALIYNYRITFNFYEITVHKYTAYLSINSFYYTILYLYNKFFLLSLQLSLNTFFSNLCGRVQTQKVSAKCRRLVARPTSGYEKH